MENETEYVPISVAASDPAVQYHPTMVQKLTQQNRIPWRWHYGRREVDLQALIAYRSRMRDLGTAKHALRYPAPEAVDAPGAA